MSFSWRIDCPDSSRTDRSCTRRIGACGTSCFAEASLCPPFCSGRPWVGAEASTTAFVPFCSLTVDVQPINPKPSPVKRQPTDHQYRGVILLNLTPINRVAPLLFKFFIFHFALSTDRLMLISRFFFTPNRST